ncbi:YsnF/AvaK domain-containing protein [Phytohalomonas tamaricis]|uniref:YsnF/AvaK domain-containing protein n=1 Tax=Phytohalomonas tamaricis TaxID=2081032 RepID=UPI000D0B194C|nr:YsnF/AvaK domain-containing protein [Phytohalomonas tamaricis]
MDEELVIAVYGTEQRAKAAERELLDSGVPASAIDRHAKEGNVSNHSTEHHDKPSFWQRLFGMESDHDTSEYDRSVDEGAVVVAVKAPAAELDRIEQILEAHEPIDIDERAAQRSYGTAAGGTLAGGTVGAATSADLVDDTNMVTGEETGLASRDATRSTDEEVLPLAEEELKVGKRDVNRGTTRVRRFVVDQPVEEDVRLRDESISVERRPVTGDRPTTADADFTDKTVEMTETDEEAVVAKNTRVREEVAIRKDVGEHTEHVSDHVRHHEVDIDETDTTVDGTRTDDPLLDPTKKTDR